MNIEALRAQIKKLDLGIKPVASDSEKDYFRYYNIDFEDRYSGIDHYFGSLCAGEFEIAVHYFHNIEATQTCFLLHGYFDHSGLYRHLIEYCLQKQWSVVIYDLPGHGLSTGERATINSFAAYQVVFEEVLSFFATNALTPWHVIAQSTGAAILTEYLCRGGAHRFEKVVLLGPLIYPTQWRGVTLLYHVLRHVKQSVARDFSVNSTDSEFLAFLEHKDPLQHRLLPVQWVGELKHWIDRFYDLAPISKSVFIVQGLEDETVDWKKNIPLFEEKLGDINTLYLKTGMHHLVNESKDNREQMFAGIDAYLKK